MKIKRNIGKNFTTSEPFYESFESKYHFFKELAVKTAQFIEPSGIILDVGCGSGISTKVYGNYGDVTGVDISEGMAIRARDHGIEVTLGDAENLPFKDDSFDSVIFSASIFLIPHPEKALKEAIRVSADNGIVGGNYPLGFFDGETDIIRKAGLTHRLISEPHKIEKIVKKMGGETETIRFGITSEFIVDFYSIPSMSKAILKNVEPGKRMMTIRKLFLSHNIPEKMDYLWGVFRIRFD